MGSREQILAALRGAQMEQVPHPDLAGLGCVPADAAAALAKQLEAAGGACWQVGSTEELAARLEAEPAFKYAARRYCTYPDLPPGNVEADAETESTALDGLDVAVIPGELAVAENGAVWVSHDNLAHRALPFICKHLYLVVPENALVPDMHAAYARLRAEHKYGGCFIAGPSKTADIEQCLVIGAQGPKTATVILLGSS